VVLAVLLAQAAQAAQVDLPVQREVVVLLVHRGQVVLVVQLVLVDRPEQVARQVLQEQVVRLV
jgi:hypothetical protein